MTAIIVISQVKLASELIAAGETIMGKQSCLTCVNLSAEDTLEDLKIKISSAIRSCLPEKPEGILILTDLFGSSATNAVVGEAEIPGIPVEVLTGVNLQMVVSSITYRNRMSLGELCLKVLSDGARGIQNAKEKLLARGKK